MTTREMVHGIAEDTNRYWRDMLKLKVGEKITEKLIDALYEFSKESLDKYFK